MEQKPLYLPVRTLKKYPKLKDYGKKSKSLGSGTYGNVYIREKDGKQVAIKQSYINSDNGLNMATIREVCVLLNLNHINIVALSDVFVNKFYINLVLDKANRTLKDVINYDYDTLGYYDDIKKYSYQLVRAVAYCHSNGIIHRDIKPANILIYDQDLLKLADFGLARSSLPTTAHRQSTNNINITMTQEVTTLWYRAPEILLGTNKYSYAIDNWSMGCVIAEALCGDILFDGMCEKTTLEKIAELIPLDQNTMTVFRSFPAFKSAIWNVDPVDMDAKCNITLIHGLLTLNPNMRMTAYDALNNEYFNEIKDEVDAAFPAPKIFKPECDEILLLRENPINRTVMMYATPAIRRSLIVWLFELHSKLYLRRRTYYLTIYLVDKYLSLRPYFPNQSLHLLGIAAMSLAADIEEIYAPDIKTFIRTTRYKENDMFDFKQKLWQELGFNLLISTAYDFGIVYLNSITTKNGSIYDKFIEILLKILMSDTYTKPDFQKHLISDISDHDLALSCIVATYKLLNLGLPTGCFKISTHHQMVAEEILLLLPIINSYPIVKNLNNLLYPKSGPKIYFKKQSL